MHAKLRTFFSTDDALKLFSIGTVVLLALNLICKLFCGLYSFVVQDFAFLLSVLFLYIAYKKHNKNVQKGLLGAVLMWYLYDEISYVVSEILSYGADSLYMAYALLSFVTFGLYAVLFVNYFVISGDHHSRPGNVILNQVIVVIISLISLFCAVLQVITFRGDLFSTCEAITWHTGLCFLMLMLATYEAHFDLFKLAREENS